MTSSSAKLPAYQRLTDDHDDLDDDGYGKERVLVRSRSTTVSWCKFRLRKVHKSGRRRSFRPRVPSLRRLLLLRRKLKLISALRVSYAKVVKRFKEGQSHFGDLFAGNYLFLQINPSSLNNLHKATTATAHHLAKNSIA